MATPDISHKITQVIMRLENILGVKASRDIRLTPCLKARILHPLGWDPATIEVHFNPLTKGPRSYYFVEVCVYWGSLSSPSNALEARARARYATKVADIAMDCHTLTDGIHTTRRRAQSVYGQLERLRALSVHEDR